MFTHRRTYLHFNLAHDAFENWQKLLLILTLSSEDRPSKSSPWDSFRSETWYITYFTKTWQLRGFTAIRIIVLCEYWPYGTCFLPPWCNITPIKQETESTIIVSFGVITIWHSTCLWSRLIRMYGSYSVNCIF